jgi:hypothetical protein
MGFQSFLRFWLVVPRPDYTFEEYVAFQPCESEAPFFGVSRKRRREKRRKKHAVLRGADCGLRLVGWWVRRGCAGLWALPVVTSSRRWSVPGSARRRPR